MVMVIDDIFDTDYLELEEVLDDSPYAEAYSCFIEDELCTSCQGTSGQVIST